MRGISAWFRMTSGRHQPHRQPEQKKHRESLNPVKKASESSPPVGRKHIEAGDVDGASRHGGRCSVPWYLRFPPPLCSWALTTFASYVGFRQRLVFVRRGRAGVTIGPGWIQGSFDLLVGMPRTG